MDKIAGWLAPSALGGQAGFDYYSLAILLIGSVFILVLARRRFADPAVTLIDGWEGLSLTLADLTTRHRYNLSFCLYVLGLEIIFVLATIAGPQPFFDYVDVFLGGSQSDIATGAVGVGVSGDSPPNWFSYFPLVIAFGFFGFILRIPPVIRIETEWRRTIQEFTLIPCVALELASLMKRKVQDLSCLQHSEEYKEFVEPTDHEASAGSALHYWARLSATFALVDALRHGGKFSENAADDRDQFVEIALLNRKRSAIDQLHANYLRLSGTIGEIRELTRTPDRPQSISHWRRQIETIYDKLCILLVCAIIVKQPRAKGQERALEFLGFLQPAEPPESGGHDLVVISRDSATDSFMQARISDAAIAFEALMVSTLVHAAVVILAVVASPVIPWRDLGWPDVDLGMLMALYQWTVPALMVYGAAIASTIFFRKLFVGDWFGRRFGIDINQTSETGFLGYIFIGVLCGVASLVAYLYYIVGLSIDTTETFIDTVVRLAPICWPVVLLGGCSAVFITRILDLASTNQKKRTLYGTVAVFVLATAVLQGIQGWHLYNSVAGSADYLGALSFSIIGSSVFAMISGLWMAGRRLAS